MPSDLREKLEALTVSSSNASVRLALNALVFEGARLALEAARNENYGGVVHVKDIYALLASLSDDPGVR